MLLFLFHRNNFLKVLRLLIHHHVNKILSNFCIYKTTKTSNYISSSTSIALHFIDNNCMDTENYTFIYTYTIQIVLYIFCRMLVTYCLYFFKYYNIIQVLYAYSIQVYTLTLLSVYYNHIRQKCSSYPPRLQYIIIEQT